MAGQYWDRYWAARRSRRRFLGGAATLSAGAAGLALVGCGDDDDDEPSATNTPSGGESPTAAASETAAASPTPSDPYANAKRGGIYKLDATGDPASIDPYGSTSFTAKGVASYAYSRLFKYNAAPGVAKADLRPTGDLAESFESNPDGTVWTITLRDNINFHDLAPVSGRAITADDIQFSWSRMTDEAQPNRANVAFVDKLETPDDKTIIVTLKAPNAAFLDVFTDANNFWVMPTEAEGGFDPTTTMIGSGPWVFDSYQASSQYSFNRNPAWHFDGFPLMDRVEVSIITEYANRLAQFQAGNTHVSGIAADDIVNVKNSFPDVQLYGEVSQLLSFFFMDPNPDSPWNKDPRVRQAISMAIDRGTLLDFAYNVSTLKAAGLNVSERWNNLIPAGNERFWLDPLSDAQGESKKYFEYNPDEAAALLSAAGFPEISTTYQYTPVRYGSVFDSVAEAHIEMLEAVGFNLTVDPQDYNSIYFPNTFQGNFTGIAFGLETPFPEASGYPNRMFRDNPLNHSRIITPEMTELADKQQTTLDPEERIEVFHEIQRKNAENMYYIPNNVGAGTGWTGYQGFVKNIETQTVPGSYAGPTEETAFVWLDL